MSFFSANRTVVRGWEGAFYTQRGGELGVCHARLLSVPSLAVDAL